MEPYIEEGFYFLGVSNNNIQFVTHWTAFEIKPVYYVIDIWPKIMLVRTDASLPVHKVQIELTNFDEDARCYFMANTVDRGVQFETPATETESNLIVPVEILNSTHVTC